MTELAPDLAPTPEQRLAQAEAMVRTYCGWHIAPERDESLVLDGPGGPNLLLPSLHVVDVASVTEADVLLDPDAGDYTWSAAGIVTRGLWVGGWPNPTGQTYAAAWWTTQLRGIAVELTHGYAEVPPDVTAVVQGAAQRMIENPTGLEQQTVGPFSEKYATGTGGSGAFTAGDLAVLDRYRLPWRP